MSGDALGLKMTVQLRRLMRQHGIEQTVWDLCHVPMVAPTQHPQILSGYAATTHLDRSRMRFRKWAFPSIAKSRSIPLYYKHRENERVGHIDSLAYDDAGQLLISATVTHPEARRCNAFSVGAVVHDYEIKNADNRDTFHAVINSAELTEVSLTDVPANQHALVRSRCDVCLQAEFYGNMLSLVSGMQRALTLMQHKEQRA